MVPLTPSRVLLVDGECAHEQPVISKTKFVFYKISTWKLYVMFGAIFFVIFCLGFDLVEKKLNYQ